MHAGGINFDNTSVSVLTPTKVNKMSLELSNNNMLSCDKLS